MWSVGYSAWSCGSRGLLFPSPILHDLRGEFDEIPRDVDARHWSDRDGGGQVMKEMSELVEYGLHLPVGQEGRDIAFGRRQVSRDDPDVWLELPVVRSTGL